MLSHEQVFIFPFFGIKDRHEIQDLKDWLLVEQEEKQELMRKLHSSEQECKFLIPVFLILHNLLVVCFLISPGKQRKLADQQSMIIFDSSNKWVLTNQVI